MLERIRRFSQLPTEAQILFLRAVVLLPVVSMRLRLRGFQTTRDALLRQPIQQPPSVSSDHQIDYAKLTARMVRAAAHHGLGDPSCLEESLVLLKLLASLGIPAQLRIGVKRNQPKFEAHAWVECCGIALNETGALHDHYAPFDAEFSASPPAQS